MPWRATWSSMWSRNGMPVASSARPLPSRSTLTAICVSRVSRSTSRLARRGAGGAEVAEGLIGLAAVRSMRQGARRSRRGVPTVMRRQFASSGCEPCTFFTRIRRCFSPSNSRSASGTRASMKLACARKDGDAGQSRQRRGEPAALGTIVAACSPSSTSSRQQRARPPPASVRSHYTAGAACSTRAIHSGAADRVAQANAGQAELGQRAHDQQIREFGEHAAGSSRRRTRDRPRRRRPGPARRG